MSGFEGIQVAAITPRGKNGDVDMGAAFELIDFLCGAGARGIVLFAATGEYPACAADERARLTYLAVKRSRVPVLAGVGSATLDGSLDLAREARDAGVGAVILPPPFFYRYEPEDLCEFYLQFARQFGRGTPILVSNTRAMASELPEETALSLLGTGLFAGIEEAHDDAEKFLRILAAAGAGGFTVLSGNDSLFVRARCAGARGAVSPVACAAPELIMGLDRAIAGRDQARIERLQTALSEFLGWAARFPWPALVKVATGLRGLKTGPIGVPLTAEKQRLLEEFRGWFPAWLDGIKRDS